MSMPIIVLQKQFLSHSQYFEDANFTFLKHFIQFFAFHIVELIFNFLALKEHKTMYQHASFDETSDQDISQPNVLSVMEILAFIFLQIDSLLFLPEPLEMLPPAFVVLQNHFYLFLKLFYFRHKSSQDLSQFSAP